MKRGKKKNKISQIQKDYLERKKTPAEKLGIKGDMNSFLVDAPSNLPQRKIQVDKITPDELLFAYEWANNPTEPEKALVAAGIVKKNDSITHMREVAFEMTNDPRVIEAYQMALFHRVEALQVTTNKIDSHLSVIAFTDRGLCKREDGSQLQIHEMPWEIRQCVQEFEEKMFYPPKGHPYKKTRVKFYSATEALRMLRSNKKEDHERIMGMAKIVGGENGTINIQNFVNSGNTFHNGHNFTNNTTEQIFDITRLTEEELVVFMKAMAREMPDNLKALERDVNEVIEIELSEILDEEEVQQAI